MPPAKVPDQARCCFTTPDGRRCREFCSSDHASFCLYHARKDAMLQHALQADNVVAEVLGSITNLRTASAVNDALAKLLLLRARRQLSSRDAAIFAYICFLALQTLKGVEAEFTQVLDQQAWKKYVAQSLKELLDLPQLPKPSRAGAKEKLGVPVQG